jgi:CTP:molybdopterin cytidylyltransferase MocA
MTAPTAPQVVGLLLAAGGGRRMGRPKALLRDRYDVPFLVRAVEVLRDGGCAEVTVVLGAAADEARGALPRDGVAVVEAERWEEGMGESLRAGLAALDRARVAALVHLVDLPDVGAGVVRRMVGGPPTTASLARATYHGRPGHPVLLGRDHWAGVVESATGDRGARDYLAAHEADVRLVECGDLADGHDVDSPADL